MDNEGLVALAEAVKKQGEVLEWIVSDGDVNKMRDARKAAAAGPTGPASLFGPGGIFSTPGLESDILTAHIRPTGLLARLPRFGSVMEQPRFGTITGVTAQVGANATNPCDDNPAGFLKGCNLTAQFGRVAKDTQTIDFDQTFRQLHGGINTELRLRGQLLGLNDLDPADVSDQDVVNIYTMAEMVTAVILAERTLCAMTWNGTPSANTAGGGYKEFPGLDNQIATGQVDADTNQACPALDSDVKDFNFNNVEGTSPSIHNYLSQLEWYLRFNADRMGLEPMTAVIGMNPNLWFVFSEIWPCQYNTNRCALSAIGAGTESQTIIDGRENVTERDQMRRSMTVDINGRNYPVVVDNCIPELTNITSANLNAGQFSSSIYFIPMTIVGGFPVTFLEHVDYRRGARDVGLLHGLQDFWTDRGLYSWAIENQKWCYKLSVKIEPRIVLKTPQLAGRIDNIMYEPLQHLRDVDPDSPYHLDGGVSLRGTPSVSAAWL